MVLPFLGAIGSTLFGTSAATAATIGAAGSIVGGAMNARSQRKAIEAQNAYNEAQTDPANIRAKFENAGFNPLLGINGWQPALQNAIPSASMGSAIAEAGAIAQGYFNDRHQEESENTKLRQANRKLQEKLGDKYLRPVVGGIFGGGDRPLGGSPVVGNAPLESPRPLSRGGDPRLFDERAPIWVLDHATQNYKQIPAGVADRLNLEPGDTWISEDNAAVYSEVGGELVSAGDWLSGGIGRLGFPELPKWEEPEWMGNHEESPPVVPLKLKAFTNRPEHSSGRM